MATRYTVTLSKVMKELSLNPISMPDDPDRILISSTDVNRPGLELNGFFDYYDKDRIIILGNAETAFLNSISPERRLRVLDQIFSKRPPAVIIARGLKPVPELLQSTKENDVPLLSTSETTSSLVARLVSFMNWPRASHATAYWSKSTAKESFW